MKTPTETDKIKALITLPLDNSAYVTVFNWLTKNEQTLKQNEEDIAELDETNVALLLKINTLKKTGNKVTEDPSVVATRVELLHCQDKLKIVTDILNKLLDRPAYQKPYITGVDHLGVPTVNPGCGAGTPLQPTYWGGAIGAGQTDKLKSMLGSMCF